MDSAIEKIISALAGKIENIKRRLERLESLDLFVFTISNTAPTNNLFAGKVWYNASNQRLYIYDPNLNYGGMFKAPGTLVKSLGYAAGLAAPPYAAAINPFHAYGARMSGSTQLYVESYRDGFFHNGTTINAGNNWRLEHYLSNAYNQNWLLGSTNNSDGTTSQWSSKGLTINSIVPPNQWAAEYTALAINAGAPGAVYIDQPTIVVRELGALPPQDNGSIVIWFRADVPCRQLTTGTTMAYWGDGGGTGLTNAQAVAPNQPTWTTGVTPVYPAISFDGTNDFMLLDNPTAFNLNAPFTLIVKAKSLGAGVSGTLQTIFGKGDASLAVGNAARRKLQIGRNGANVRISSGADTQFIDTPCDFTTGFHTVAWVCRASNDHSIYVDSAAAVNSSTVLDLSTFNTVQPTIGQSFSTGLTENWNGYIQEIALHSSALSATQVANEINYMNAKT